MQQDQRLIANFTTSRLAASLSGAVDGLESAWQHSSARQAAMRIAAGLGTRRSGAATMMVAALVALGMQQLRETPEPALWILPATVLIWSAGTLLWPLLTRR